MSEHIVPRTTYFAVFGALLVGTAITVFAANIDFGRMNDVIAMTIAVTKMMLVLLFFMHVRYSSRLIWVIVASMFFWLLILLLLTLTDYTSRDWFGSNVGGIMSRQEPPRSSTIGPGAGAPHARWAVPPRAFSFSAAGADTQTC